MALYFLLLLGEKYKLSRIPLRKYLKVFSATEWSSWLMRKSAVSAWMEKQISSCPVPTASVRSASINGNTMDRCLIAHIREPLFSLFFSVLAGAGRIETVQYAACRSPPPKSRGCCPISQQRTTWQATSWTWQMMLATLTGLNARLTKLNFHEILWEKKKLLQRMKRLAVI